jgi:hypothetical protein
VKTRHKHSRCAFLLSSGFLLVVLISNSPHLSAEDRRAESPMLEPKEGESINRNEEPTGRGNTPGILPVGPSGEEIHDYLYPTTKDGKVVTPSN